MSNERFSDPRLLRDAIEAEVFGCSLEHINTGYIRLQGILKTHFKTRISTCSLPDPANVDGISVVLAACRSIGSLCTITELVQLVDYITRPTMADVAIQSAYEGDVDQLQLIHHASLLLVGLCALQKGVVLSEHPMLSDISYLDVCSIVHLVRSEGYHTRSVCMPSIGQADNTDDLIDYISDIIGLTSGRNPCFNAMMFVMSRGYLLCDTVFSLSVNSEWRRPERMVH